MDGFVDIAVADTFRGRWPLFLVPRGGGAAASAIGLRVAEPMEILNWRPYSASRTRIATTADRFASTTVVATIVWFGSSWNKFKRPKTRVAGPPLAPVTARPGTTSSGPAPPAAPPSARASRLAP